MDCEEKEGNWGQYLNMFFELQDGEKTDWEIIAELAREMLAQQGEDVRLAVGVVTRTPARVVEAGLHVDDDEGGATRRRGRRHAVSLARPGS